MATDEMDQKQAIEQLIDVVADLQSIVKSDMGNLVKILEQVRDHTQVIGVLADRVEHLEHEIKNGFVARFDRLETMVGEIHSIAVPDGK